MSLPNLSSKVKIIRIENNDQKEMKDLTAREIQMRIFVNEVEVVSLNCSPGDFKSLGVGFLYTNSLISELEDIDLIDVRRDKIQIKLKNQFISFDFLKTNCLTSDFSSYIKDRKSENRFKEDEINLRIIPSLLIKMQKKAKYFDLTGGVHSCGLADHKGTLLLFCEDISRYNTIDRIFGKALRKKISLDDKIILTSCRITSGIIKKIINGKISIIISRSAVTDKAVKLAKEFGLTLIGFARGNRMNIYTTNSTRIIETGSLQK